jgi:hypothetical protein
MVRTISAFSALSVICVTNDRSIFRVSMGKRCR